MRRSAPLRSLAARLSGPAVDPSRTGTPTEVAERRGPPSSVAVQLDQRVLLSVLSAVRNGDFGVQMPLDWTGVEGKIADCLNEVIATNRGLEAELARVSRVVGKEGKLSQRVASRGSDGVWAGSIELRKQPDRGSGALRRARRW